MIKDILMVAVLLILIAACFYAFQLVVLLIVGYVVYLCIPMIKAGNNINIRKRKWK